MRRKREKDEKDQWEKAQKKNRQILKNYNLEKDREKRRQEMSKKKIQIGEKTREHQETKQKKTREKKSRDPDLNKTKQSGGNDNWDEVQWIEEILDHKHNKREGKLLLARWDNGCEGWDKFNNLVKDDYPLVKEYVTRHRLEEKGWRLPSREKAKKLVEIVGNRSKKNGEVELECIYDNGFRDWEDMEQVESKFPDMVRNYKMEEEEQEEEE